VAAHLLEAGVDVADVYRHVYGTRSVAALKLMARALESLRLEAAGRVSVIRLTRADFLKTRAQEDDTEDVVNQGLLPPTALVSVFLREVGGGAPGQSEFAWQRAGGFVSVGCFVRWGRS
jgi:nanoRNase/pAp phosphatase (c-di-AMP/oligoRNAs hydrolase)